PVFADRKTLVIISSYSGNTEETISVFKEALKKKCKIVAVTSGGIISKLAKKNKIPLIIVESGFQPRYAMGLNFFALLRILQSLKIIPNENKNVELIIKLWKNKGKEYSEKNNQAFSIASKVIGNISLIYSADNISSAVGYRFKCQLNENSKVHAFHNVIPEMNHNEIIGWESFREKQLRSIVLTILDKDYHPKISRRFKIITELIKSTGTEVFELKSSQKNFKVRIMDLIYLIDWITYYLAVLRGFDPSEIDFIHELKNRLA
ncbi:MAG TPA: bifunctional phosphoglucose/phosphomannose isomerase, partial [Ignavibacteriaceae bacterium]